MPQLPGKYYLSDLPRLPPMPDNKERAAKPAAGHLVQQMPNRAYRQKGTTPGDTAVSSTTGLSGRLEGRAEAEYSLARSDTPRRPEHRYGCRASIGR